MKILETLGLVSFFCWFCVLPAAAHCCGHNGYAWGGGSCCWDCDHHSSRQAPQAERQSSTIANVETLDGKVAEVVYLPGPTADSGMVEIRLQSANQRHLIRLAPSGFLKQNGLLLREGDAVSVKGFRVTGMEGDLLVATELHAGNKSLALRDASGMPAW